ncbi:Glutathione-dependent formaldehyde-activating enzyme [Methylocapsa palsarum]|uniref:Glutathione-dependent formaldehyde-activating enzyme n=1 Tax=Methylocapsa palsarum TaxID=1612308 RepID=A0A1I4AGB2_9HYPH|nr:Glutathione-dependent formaldehyde-activating enzyme [Methylocapsa palsarum]
MSETTQGACFCGAIEISASGAPKAQGYCHCRSCRSWSASPVNAFTLWPAEAVKVSKGAEHVATYARRNEAIAIIAESAAAIS